MTRFTRLIAWLVGIALLLLILLPSIILGDGGADIKLQLLTGWVRFPSRLSFSAGLIIACVSALALTVVIIHGVFIRLLLTWGWRHTLCLSTMVALLFCVCLTTLHLGQQTQWLLSARNTPLRRDVSRGILTQDISNARQFITGMRLYMSEPPFKGPPTLEDMMRPDILDAAFFREASHQISSPDGVPEPWIYLGYPEDSIPGSIPVLISPRSGSSFHRIVGFADSSVRPLQKEEFIEAMQRWHDYQPKNPTKQSNHSPAQPVTEAPIP